MFQYRISHRILATNEYFGQIDTFRNVKIDNLIHLFVECEHVENVWNMLETKISEACGFLLNYNKCEILFGKIGKRYEARNIIILIVKYYIYKRWCDQMALYFEGIKKEIINYYIRYKYIAKLGREKYNFRRKIEWIIECKGLFHDI